MGTCTQDVLLHITAEPLSSVASVATHAETQLGRPGFAAV